MENIRFGDSFTKDHFADKKFDYMLANPPFGVKWEAHVNTLEKFSHVFLKALEDPFIERMEQNEEITAKYMNEGEISKIVGKKMMKEVYEQIRGEPENQA